MLKQNRLRPPRPGLTLMELVVVLAIVVALTGIVVAIIPSMIHRANVASCTANISEMDKIVQAYEGLYSEIPNKFDNLMVGNNLATFVLAGQPTPSFVAGTLTGPEAASLSNWGCVQVTNIVENPGTGGDWRPTFWPYSDSQQTPPTYTTVAGGMPVAVLTKVGADYVGLPTGANGVAATDGSTGNYKYVIFGMNKQCTLFRNMANEPPYHFADVKTEDPATFYMPFAAIYMVARDYDGTQKTMTKARYVGTVAFHDFGLATSGSHTKEWWDQLKD